MYSINSPIENVFVITLSPMSEIEKLAIGYP